MKNHITKIVIIAALIILGSCCIVVIIILANRSPVQNDNQQNTITPTPTIAYGQKATAIQNKSGFWTNAQDCCELIGWYGDWGELAKNNGGVAGSTTTLARTNNLEPFIIVSPFNQSSGNFSLPVNDTNTKSYLDSTEKFLTRYQPQYLGIGVEINLLYDKSPAKYQQFLEIYKLAYARIKSVSPSTMVFPVFQLEQLKGLRGGIFGGKNDVSKNDWKLLADFKDFSDMTGFTTYPGLIYGKPADIPADYYSQISLYTDKPVIFSELGWFTTGVKGWESNETEQAEFLTTYFNLTKDLPVVFSSWSLLYDIPNQGIFSSMGLLDEDGNKKQAYLTWKNQ
jgi:hypothetical protein